MADISNITLPDGDNYNIKDPVARTIGGSMDILQTKTYTGVIASDITTQALTNYYGLRIHPNDYNASWEITYRVIGTIDGVSAANGLGYQESYVKIVGMRDTYALYIVQNNIRHTSYRPFYYHPFFRAKAAGVTNGYGHVLGVGLRSSYNPTTAANTRTITFDILDTKECTVDFLDVMALYDDIPGTGSTNYSGLTEFNASTQGITRAGTDANNYDRTLISGNSVRCGTTAIAAANVIVGDSEGLYKHLKSGTAFDIRFPILYAYSAANANALVTNIYLSYPFSIATTQAITLTQASPVYIKGSLSGTTFTPVSTTPLTQTLPSTEDGYEYIRLGYAYSTTAIWLEPIHPIFAYRNGALREVGGDADSVEGHTVESDVPSDAVFTDTKPSAQCETAAATAAKSATCTNYALKANSYLHVNLRYANTASSALTFNVNSKGAKPLYINGAASSANNHTLPAGSYIAFYNGTYWSFRTDELLPASIDGTVNGHTLYADVPADAAFTDTTDLGSMTGTLGINQGGTGATSAGAARTALGIGTAAILNYETTVASGSNLPTGSAVMNLKGSLTVDGVKFSTGTSIIHYCESSTAAATAAKTATCENFSRVDGAVVYVKFAYANTASSPTLNISNTGASYIRYRNANISSTYLAANEVYCFVYYGSYYHMVGDVNTAASTSEIQDAVDTWLDEHTSSSTIVYESSLTRTVITSTSDIVW